MHNGTNGQTTRSQSTIQWNVGEEEIEREGEGEGKGGGGTSSNSNGYFRGREIDGK